MDPNNSSLPPPPLPPPELSKPARISLWPLSAGFIFVIIICTGLGYWFGMKSVKPKFLTEIVTNNQTSNKSEHFRIKEINLVSSVQNYAPITDTKLTDAWGLEFGDPGRVWINANSGYSVAYNGQGQYIQTNVEAGGLTVPLAVLVPSAPGASADGDDDGDESGSVQAPLTGMVFSKDRAFSGDAFVFVTEQGTISGWHPNTDGTSPLQATMRVNNYANGAIYKGVTSAKTDQGWLLYVANFGQDSIDVFNNTYQPVQMNGFVDPAIPHGYAPFNVKNINNQIYVTYTKQSLDEANDVHGLGNGYLDVYSTNGKIIKRLISGGVLDSPWGMALAPNNFGDLSNYLLVGNFGDGYINVFDPKTGQFRGTVDDAQGNPLQIDGLWSLTFGTNNGAGKSNELFFSAGPSAETQGLFGKLQPLSTNLNTQLNLTLNTTTNNLPYIDPSYNAFGSLDAAANREAYYKQPIYFSALPDGWNVGKSILSKTLNGIEYLISFQYLDGITLGQGGVYGETNLSLVQEVNTAIGTPVYIVESLAPPYENLYTSSCTPTTSSACSLRFGNGYVFISLGTYKPGAQDIQELNPNDPNLDRITDDFINIIEASNI